jgi:predicted lysophospholipase L1 biosynthesis ABC-type transport system permease subunit
MKTLRIGMILVATVIVLLMILPALPDGNVWYARKMYAQSHPSSDPLRQKFDRIARDEKRSLMIYEAAFGVALVTLVVGIALTSRVIKTRTI